MESESFKRRAYVLSMALVIALVTCAWSEPETLGKSGKNHRIRGLGSKSCQNFLDERQGIAKGAVSGFGHWLDGYLTAYSASDPASRVIDLKDREILLWWLGRYCALKPTVTFFDAVKAMVDELKPTSDPHSKMPQEG